MQGVLFGVLFWWFCGKKKILVTLYAGRQAKLKHKGHQRKRRKNFIHELHQLHE
jgi:hypothetical protein